MTKDSLVNFSRTVDKAWFGKKSFETPGLYKRLGIDYVRKYSIPTGEFWWKSLLFPIRWVKTGNQESLKNLVTTTKLWEGGHTGFGIGLAAFAADLCMKGQPELATLVTAINILGNGPGIPLSRFNRLRASDALERMQSLNQPRSISLQEYHPPLDSEDWLANHTIKETMHALEDFVLPKVT